MGQYPLYLSESVLAGWLTLWLSSFWLSLMIMLLQWIAESPLTCICALCVCVWKVCASGVYGSMVLHVGWVHVCLQCVCSCLVMRGQVLTCMYAGWSPGSTEGVCECGCHPCRSPVGVPESTPQLFGNSWKTLSACSSLVPGSPLDPCDVHLQAGEVAGGVGRAGVGSSETGVGEVMRTR